ncbi:hypothetical protein GE061_001425 [Apolygus lucorum]|uniref:Odorant receptor n=1 Tax=Apolygus lucorum TaxID=248454 RepID=A0A8S9Y717_APOLU|nr:hypothetical protein GE061_001425 [Apolygus lucorum]
MSMYVWLPPLVDCIMGVTHHPNDSLNGIATTLGLPMWTPLDADHSWTSYFIVVYMQIVFFKTVTVGWGFGIFYMSISQLTLLDEMRLLRKSLEEIDTRATQLFTLKYQRQPVNRKTKEYDDCYYECLKENIIHHQFIRKYYSEYQKLVGWTIAIPIYLSSVVLALSCSYIMLNDELRNELYNTEWYDRSKKVKQAISICLHITYMPMRLYCGYMVFNHELFSLEDCKENINERVLRGAKLLWNKNETTFDLLFSLVHGRENHCTYTGTPYDEFLKSRRHTFLQYGPTLFTYTNITVMSMYVWLPPLVDCIMGVTHHPNDPQNGIATTLGLPMWTPLDADHSWTNTRATQLFTLKYQRQPVNRKTKEYDDCYYECLKENIIHHQFIRKIYGEYQKRVGWTIAIPIYLSSVVLALSSSYIMLDNRNALKRSMDVLRIIGDSLLTFLTCHAGEMIAYENDELRNELYNTEWYDRSKKVKQAISICLHITYMPMRLYGGYMVFNHELLSTVSSVWHLAVK